MALNCWCVLYEVHAVAETVVENFVWLPWSVHCEVCAKGLRNMSVRHIIWCSRITWRLTVGLFCKLRNGWWKCMWSGSDAKCDAVFKFHVTRGIRRIEVKLPLQIYFEFWQAVCQEKCLTSCFNSIIIYCGVFQIRIRPHRTGCERLMSAEASITPHFLIRLFPWIL